MPTRSRSSARGSDEGRFFEIQAEVAARRRGPYVLTPDIVIQPITRGQAKAMREARDENEQLRILLGEHADAVEALFDDRPLDEWVAFQRDLQQHFYGQGATEIPGGSQGS
ncbi:hypothetical protein [Nocardia transvalensis]|uniref:hypothetical protein n=1 Tax=Nocardia transvalensis TaxID=37333 RepID=UPI001892FCD4|nr:hypothetical protein [Nocardia transvalensis]MBF6332374.1 hypothetical protein [Nocardia transvalensis]